MDFTWIIIGYLILASGNALLLLIANLTAPKPQRGPFQALIFGFLVGLVPYLNIKYPVEIYIPAIIEHLKKLD